MIEDVIKGIKYNQGSNTLIKTLNNNKFNTYLITGGLNLYQLMLAND